MCEVESTCPGCTCTDEKPYCLHCVMTYLGTVRGEQK
jgi:hypothetical protein